MEKKFEQSKGSDNKKIGKDKPKFEQSKDIGSNQVRLVFKGNRTFELHIGRTLYRFEGRESKYVPKSVLDHKDFTEQIKQYFVIGE